MWLYVKLAWRNIFRNKRRTFIAGTAIGIGLASLIFSDALMIGMEENMVDSATSSFLGEAQIHRNGFRQTQEVELTIDDLPEVVSELEKEKTVKNFTLRTMSFGMVTSPADVGAVSLVGIDPATERYISKIDDAIRDGAYFEGDNPRDIVFGSKLAEILEVSIGDRVVVTVAQAGSGDLSQEMFRVSGIYHFNVSELDGGMAFIRLDKARQMLALDGGAHEIALTFTDRTLSRDPELPFWQQYSRHDNEAVSWTEILPQFVAVFEMSSFSMAILAVILFGVVSLGIINTLFMSLYERMFEFGVLRAVGTRPFGIGRLILLEAAALSVISIGLGIVLGFVLSYIITKTGIDYRGIEFAGVTFQELLYPVMTVKQYIYYPFWVFVFTTIIGIYPAVYAARMSPAAAMRKSL